MFFREKYRYDQGNAFLVFINFALLVASLVSQYGGHSEMIKYYVIAGLLATWFLGWILDRVIKVQDAQERISLKRSPIWKENFQHHENLDHRLQEIERKLDLIVEGH